jgi:Scavenger mRNA decapping enzyme C-term binding
MAVSECIFCKIVAGTAESQELYRDETTLAFMDIHPANEGHCLVIPQAHFATVFEMTPCCRGSNGGQGGARGERDAAAGRTESCAGEWRSCRADGAACSRTCPAAAGRRQSTPQLGS